MSMILLQFVEQQNEDNTGVIIAIVVLLVILLGYLALCALVGKYAKNRGRSFWALFIVSIFLNPVIGFIIAALLGESQQFREDRIRRETEIRMQVENQYRQQYYSQNPPPMPNTNETNQE